QTLIGARTLQGRYSAISVFETVRGPVGTAVTEAVVAAMTFDGGDPLFERLDHKLELVLGLHLLLHDDPPRPRMLEVSTAERTPLEPPTLLLPSESKHLMIRASSTRGCRFRKWRNCICARSVSSRTKTNSGNGALSAPRRERPTIGSLQSCGPHL